jgi:glycosidase
MDAFMDFPLTKEVRRVFAQNALPLGDLLDYYGAHQGDIPAGCAPGFVLDNHDMHRFLWLAENNASRLRLAALFQMTMPGFPVVYYGTEVGLSQHAGPQAQDKYAREPMPWGDMQDRDLLAYFHDLIALRQEHSALRAGDWLRVASRVTDAFGARPGDCGAYLRFDASEAILVVLNAATSSAAVAIGVSDIGLTDDIQRFDKALATSPYCEIGSNRSVVQCRMPGLSGVVVRLR